MPGILEFKKMEIEYSYALMLKVELYMYKDTI